MQLTVILTLHFEGFSSLDVPALQRALRQQQATIQQQLQSFLLLHQSGLGMGLKHPLMFPGLAPGKEQGREGSPSPRLDQVGHWGDTDKALRIIAQSVLKLDLHLEVVK